jgi:Arc/MetJ-type ribon-helix-helix transcriptional regulator
MLDMNSRSELQTTTVRLPRGLYEQARTAVKKGGVASSLNDFLIAALEEKLREMKEQELDEAFAQMGKDEEYQREAIALARSFEKSDWEAYKVANASNLTNGSSAKKRSPKSASR